jgi:hypothetical protein
VREGRPAVGTINEHWRKVKREGGRATQFDPDIILVAFQGLSSNTRPTSVV